ncbi:hypothetical protein HDU93_001002 [Gonapodya sp. JEL0774]|nr:hypothetical protein HDU93_001002 [Gonapodya sp. JEL0774]
MELNEISEPDSELSDLQSRIARLPIPFELLLAGLSYPRPAPPLFVEVADDGTTSDEVAEDLVKQGITTVFTKLSLPSIPPLESVDLSRNQIQRIGDLSRHRYLRSLTLERNLIMGIEGLDGCKYLTELRLGHNGISKLTGLDNLPLTKLDLRWNRLTSLSGLSRLPNLTHLIAPHNAVSSLSSLFDCSVTNPRLSHLDLAHNLIADIAELNPLKDAVMLRALVLKGNPVAGRGDWGDGDGDQGDGKGGPPRSNASRSISSSTGQIASFSSLHQSAVALHTVGSRPPSSSTISHSKSPVPADTYRLSAIFMLPCLTSLDDHPVTAEDKVAAVNRFDPPPEVRAAVAHAERTAKQAKLYARVRHTDLMHHRSGRLRPVVLCGPSGVGKRTLAARLAAESPHVFGLAVSHTTRAPRPGEEDGVHYRFVGKAEMEEMVEAGEFVESVTLFGNMYGTSVGEVDRVAEEGKVCVMSVEVEGIAALRRSTIRPRYVYVAAPNIEAISTRLQNRQRTMHSSHISRSRTQTKLSSAGHSNVRSEDDTASLMHGLQEPPSLPKSEEPGTVAAVEEEIRRWMENAEQSLVSAEKLGMNFFDLVVINDNVELAYRQLKDFALLACKPSAYDDIDFKMDENESVIEVGQHVEDSWEEDRQ